MDDSFRGKHTVKMDGKGRVSVPAGFRRALEANDPNFSEDRNATVFLAYWKKEAFINCMTQATVDELSAKLRTMPRGSRKRIAFEEFLFESTYEVRLDDTNRILMPKELRETLLLEGEVIFGGRGEGFRIYSPEVPGPAISMLEREMAEMPEDASPFALLDEEEDA